MRIGIASLRSARRVDDLTRCARSAIYRKSGLRQSTSEKRLRRSIAEARFARASRYAGRS